MRLVIAVPIVLFSFSVAQAQTPAPVVTDAAGKELTLKNWKILAGTRKLNWVDGKPVAFEFRETGSTSFKDGIVTLVPLSRIEAVAWDYEKETVIVRVAGLDKPLTGSTKYKDINVLTIEADVDQGAAGVAALRFRGGVAKGGIRGVKFPAAKMPEAAKETGPAFTFTVPPDGKSKAAPTTQTAHRVQALYRFSTGEDKPQTYLMFKKTLKVELSTVAKLTLGLQRQGSHGRVRVEAQGFLGVVGDVDDVNPHRRQTGHACGVDGERSSGLPIVPGPHDQPGGGGREEGVTPSTLDGLQIRATRSINAGKELAGVGSADSRSRLRRLGRDCRSFAQAGGSSRTSIIGRSRRRRHALAPKLSNPIEAIAQDSDHHDPANNSPADGVTAAQ